MLAIMRLIAAICAALFLGLVSGTVMARPDGATGAPASADKQVSNKQVGHQQVRQYAQKKKRKGAPNGYRPAPSEQDRTLDDFRQGRIKPFSEIRRNVNRRVKGRVIDAQLDRASSPWVYNVRVLTDDGNVVAVRLDAQTGRIMEVKGRRR